MSSLSATAYKVIDGLGGLVTKGLGKLADGLDMHAGPLGDDADGEIW